MGYRYFLWVHNVIANMPAVCLHKWFSREGPGCISSNSTTTFSFSLSSWIKLLPGFAICKNKSQHENNKKKTRWDKLRAESCYQDLFQPHGLAGNLVLNCPFLSLQTPVEVSQKCSHSIWARFWSFLFVIKVQLGWEPSPLQYFPLRPCLRNQWYFWQSCWNSWIQPAIF